MTDWDMVVETWPGVRVPERAAQLSQVRARVEVQRPEAVHDDAAMDAGVAGKFHLRGPRHAVEHRRARTCVSRSAAGSSTRVPRRRSFADSHHHDPDLRAVPREHGLALHDRRIRPAVQPDRSAERGCEIRDDRDIDLARWPEQTYQITSQIDFPTQKNIFFHREKFSASGRGVSTARSTSSRAAAN